jgi:hypothetical protein
MKFRVEREALADAVAWTAKSLPARPPVPVLAGVLLEVDNHRLTVSGFDYEVSGQVGSVNRAVPQVISARAPSTETCTGFCAGRDRVISASNRPETSTRPAVSASTSMPTWPDTS